MCGTAARGRGLQIVALGTHIHTHTHIYVYGATICAHKAILDIPGKAGRDASFPCDHECYLPEKHPVPPAMGLFVYAVLVKIRLNLPASQILLAGSGQF